MIFSSMLFLWGFLPVTIIFSSFKSNKINNSVLLFMSILFYAWGEPVYIVLMLLSITINYIIGLLIEKYSYHKSNKKIFLFIGILINLLILGFFKYYGFFLDLFSLLFSKEISYKLLPLPIGISFYTFQAMSYIIDLYRGKYKAQKNILNMSLYIAFFPQLIAGPIVRYEDFYEQIKNRIPTIEKRAEGIRRFIYGLSKKVLIANVLAAGADKIYDNLPMDQVTGLMALVAAMFYMLQIYYDFSGYSDMAIGLGKMFGFDFRENFDYPYISKSITEFWRRWHISLSTWFKEYVYIPLGGNRKGKIRTYINLAIVFVLTGFWHGADFSFIFWGMFHGFFIIFERLWFHKIISKAKIINLLYTNIVVMVGWVFFRVTSIHDASRYILKMFQPWKYTDSVYSIMEVVTHRQIVIFFVGVLGAGLIQNKGLQSRCVQKYKHSIFELIFCFTLLFLCIVSLASNTYNPFIYFRF